MGGVGNRVDRRDDEAAKSGYRVLLTGGRSRLLLSVQQLVHGVDDRRVEVALVASEHLEGLIAVPEKGAKTPGQLNADEGEQHCPSAHDRERFARVYAALLAHHAQPLVQRVHAEQSRHARDRDGLSVVCEKRGVYPRKALTIMRAWAV